MQKIRKSSLRRFQSDRKGALTFEMVILLPTLMFLMIGMAGIFDVMVKQTDALRATHSVSDLVSRQTEVDNEFIDRLYEVYKSMSNSNDEQATMRVSSVRETSTGRLVDWSYVVGQATYEGKSVTALGETSSEISSRVPALNPGEAVVLVETFRDYDVPFRLMENFGIEDMLFSNFMVFPLRFSVRLANTDFPQEGGNSTAGYDDDDDPTDPDDPNGS